MLFKWPDRLCCDVQTFCRSILELNYMLDLFISSRNVFSFSPLGICVSKIWTEIVPVLFQIISPNAGERNNALPGWVPGGLQGFW